MAQLIEILSGVRARVGNRLWSQGQQWVSTAEWRVVLITSKKINRSHTYTHQQRTTPPTPTHTDTTRTTPHPTTPPTPTHTHTTRTMAQLIEILSGKRAGVGNRLWSRGQQWVSTWPLHDIVIANIVWCIAYKREVGRGVLYCPIIVQ